MRRQHLSFFALAFLANTAAAAGNELVIPGTGDGMEVLRALSAVYVSAGNPPVFIPPSVGSGGGKIAVAQGKAVLARIAVPLTETEKASGLTAVPIFRVPAAIYVHRSVGSLNATPVQLVRLFAGEIKNWIELGGPDLRVRVIRREEIDSTLQVLRATIPGWKELVITERSKLATTTQEAIETIGSIEGAVGWGPFTKSLEGQVEVLRIDGAHPNEVRYPSFTRISLLYRNTHLPPEAKRFIEFSLSPTATSIYAAYGAIREDSSD